jgi:hypothetical protein
VSASIDTAEPSLTKELLSLILVYDLLWIEIFPLVIVVEDVTISQIKHIIIMQEYPLRRIYFALRSALELQLRFYIVDQLLHSFHLSAMQVQYFPLLSIINTIKLDH